MSARSHTPTATLVAIAKDEGRYLLEWISYHLAIGFSRIVVYNNDSSDRTTTILRRLCSRLDTVDCVYWPSDRLGIDDSPQVTAYNHALHSLWSDWVMFLDLDEYLVPFGDGSLQGFLARVPAEVASVHVNWRGFGSSGVISPDYELVTTTFRRCSPADWGNNTHFKSLARTTLVDKVHIHNITTTAGERVLSDFRPFSTHGNGMSDRIVHDAIQINHYQCKTFAEFEQRMRRGDANYHPAHDFRARDASLTRFGHFDLNTCEDTGIAAFHDRHMVLYRHLQTLL